MPAYRERVYICPNQNGQPGWIMDFPLWWERQAFYKKFGTRKFDTGHPIYVNYGLLLTAGEAAAWNKQCTVEFAQKPHTNAALFVDAMQLLEVRLKAASWVIVEMYEWESGMS